MYEWTREATETEDYPITNSAQKNLDVNRGFLCALWVRRAGGGVRIGVVAISSCCPELPLQHVLVNYK